MNFKMISLGLILFFTLPAISLGADEDDGNAGGNAGGNTDGINAWKLNFGIGVDFYDEAYIDSATILGEDRIVTIEKSFDTRPSGWLSVSWNVFGSGAGSNYKALALADDVAKVKWGFFAGVKVLGTDNTNFSAFALGPQVTFETSTDRDISIGLGWVTHTNKRLANGITVGESLPERFDSVKYEEFSENNFMLMFSIGI